MARIADPAGAGPAFLRRANPATRCHRKWQTRCEPNRGPNVVQDYSSKGARYFGNARTEIEPLLATVAERTLEIGCGAGQTMHWLKQTGRVREAWGIELLDTAGGDAREHFDHLLLGDAERLIDEAFGTQRFDLILCLDVLEHMIDPWQFTASLQSLLAPGGKLVVSLPNVRCVTVVVPLVLLGRWRYRDEGILDRTHLRFFTREGALALIGGARLQVERCIDHRPPNSKLARIHRLTLGLFRDFTAKQYLIAAGATAVNDADRSAP